jgi:hypothetical protein
MEHMDILKRLAKLYEDGEVYEVDYGNCDCCSAFSCYTDAFKETMADLNEYLTKHGA